ncbi:ABC transporter, ATP-binding protein [Lachnospiraceae bacterium TWA4]|nr:ABC transporter, ATP-binding protein [Lachnospiraceae bacterium TWA4]
MSEIVVRHANKYFGAIHVLKDISVEFVSGQIYGIIGRNGSGKTVLFKSICGLIPVTNGEITVDGQVIGKDIDIPEDIGIIIETPGFLNQFNAYDNLKYLARIRGKIGKKEILETLDRVGLSDTGRKKVKKFSMGMRQRLGIAQAIMEKPKILILDEPMNGLDKQGVCDIRNLLLELKKQGTLIILASHNSEDIDCLCDEVYEIDAGVMEKRK